MIRLEELYFAGSGDLTPPDGPTSWYILCWDQRRTITVNMAGYIEDSDILIDHLKKHIDNLGPDVYAIYVSDDGDLISASTDPADDFSRCVYYPPLEEIPRSVRAPVIRRSEMQEVDRLGPNVDLVAYPPSSQATGKKAVFKYYFLYQFKDRIWTEMNILLRLPRHPNLVPLDRIVVEELKGGVVGFTTLYIPGGTLDTNISRRTFKLKWLRQLAGVVDDLNLKYGVVHQDIAARNLLVDDETDSIMLFDFNYSGLVNGFRLQEGRDDIKGVIFTIYEIITGDESFRSVPHEQQDLAAVEKMDEWAKHPDVTLDHPVSDFRLALKEWADKRRREEIGDQSEFIDVPIMAEAPPREIHSWRPDGTEVTYHWRCWDIGRQEERKKGNAILNWERPPKNALKDGTVLLSTGEVVE